MSGLGSHLRKDLSLTFRDWRSLAIALALPALIVVAYARLDLGVLAGSDRNPDAFILALSTTFPVLLVASTALVQERRLGTLGRLGRSPASVLHVVASKSLAALALLALQVAIIVTTALVALAETGTGIVENTGRLALVLLLSGLAAQTLGLLIGALVTTETQAMQLTSLAFLLMFVLSGFLQPLDELGAVGAAARYAPVALAYAGAKAAIEGVAGVAELAALAAVPVALLLATALATRLRA